jgi:FMN-dependent NADH-azoreductase
MPAKIDTPVSKRDAKMTTLLQINTSLFGSDGQSSRLADAFVAAWRDQHPGTAVTVRDLAVEPVPHLTSERFNAFLTPPDRLTAKQRLDVAHSNTLISELEQANVLVFGLPMYNFGVPSGLKAWMDHVARAGVTFRYTERGPQGLLHGKKAYVFATRGGRYAHTPSDTQSGFVRDFLAFLGITDVEFVYAEGLALGDAARDDALAGAGAAIERIAA